VAAGQDLQAALDAAVPGDVVTLAAGATFKGNFVLRAKAGAAGKWIVVRTSGALPAEGSRVTPANAGAMPKLLSENHGPVIATEAGAQGWRLVGLEISTIPEVATSGGLVMLGDGSGAQNTLALVPGRLVIDRSYIHGTPTLEVRRCVALNSATTAVIGSYLDDCHQHGNDSQAIAGWNGPGPYRIENNYMAAGHEVVTFGGSDPGIYGLIPSDIVIRRNHITRPLAWRGKWDVKNLIEFKSGRRVLIENNVLENNWIDAQVGFAILLWSVNQDGGAPYTSCEDITVRYNRVINVAAGFNLSSRYSTPSNPMRRVSITNNVLTGLQENGRVFQVLGRIADLHIEHNTGLGSAHDLIINEHGFDPGGVPTNFVFTNNLVGGEYTIFTPTGQGAAGLAFVPGAVVLGNLFVGPWAPVIAMPQGNSTLGTADDLHLGSDGALPPDSPYRGSATDGRDPGADVPGLNARLSGVATP
jgi:hypothetical protein